MKKLLLLSALMLMSLSVFAEGSHLLFKTADGSVHAITALGVEIRFADGNMVAVNGEESLTLAAADLASMEFGDQTTMLEGIATTHDDAVAVANISGQRLGRFASLQEAQQRLAPGIYIAKNNSGGTIKLIVRK